LLARIASSNSSFLLDNPPHTTSDSVQLRSTLNRHPCTAYSLNASTPIHCSCLFTYLLTVYLLIYSLPTYLSTQCLLNYVLTVYLRITSLICSLVCSLVSSFIYSLVSSRIYSLSPLHQGPLHKNRCPGATDHKGVCSFEFILPWTLEIFSFVSFDGVV
jgi:hypothetical protein